VAQEAGNFSSASTFSESVSLPADTSSSSTIPVSSTPNLIQAISWMPSAPSFSMPTGMPGTPGTPGPPGIATSTPISSHRTFPSAVMDSSSAVLRPTMPTAPMMSNSSVQPQICAPYASFPAMAPPPQGMWLPPPQMGGIPRSPFQAYPTAFPGPYPLPARGMPLPSVPLPDSQPPGVTPMGTALAISVSSAASGHMLAGTLKTQTELPPPGIGMPMVSY
jgi:transcription elongation regulator 1